MLPIIAVIVDGDADPCEDEPEIISVASLDIAGAGDSCEFKDIWLVAAAILLGERTVGLLVGEDNGIAAELEFIGCEDSWGPIGVVLVAMTMLRPVETVVGALAGLPAAETGVGALTGLPTAWLNGINEIIAELACKRLEASCELLGVWLTSVSMSLLGDPIVAVLVGTIVNIVELAGNESEDLCGLIGVSLGPTGAGEVDVAAAEFETGGINVVAKDDSSFGGLRAFEVPSITIVEEAKIVEDDEGWTVVTEPAEVALDDMLVKAVATFDCCTKNVVKVGIVSTEGNAE